MNKFSLIKYFQTKDTNVPTSEFLEDIVHKYTLSLREQEALCNIFNVVIRTKINIRLKNWTLIIFIFLIILKLKFPDIYKNLGNKNFSDFLDETIKNIDSHCASDDEHSNYYLELLEFLLLRTIPYVYDLDSSENVTEHNIKKFNFDENKIERLINIEMEIDYMSEEPDINLQMVLNIKKAIEISNSFKIN